MENFTLRYVYWLPDFDAKDDFFSGKFLKSKILSLTQYVLFNLSNVTLEEITEDMMRVEFGDYTRRLDINSLIIKSLNNGFIHTVPGWTTVLKETRFDTEHYSPIFPADEIKLITVIEPEYNNNNTDLRLSLGGFGQFVWEAIIMCILSMSIVSMMFKRYIHQDRRKIYVFIKYLWFYLSTIFESQGTVFSKESSFKIILSIWILTTTILTKAFSGNLKSHLAVSETRRINTLEDLKNYPGTSLTLNIINVYLRELKKDEKIKLEDITVNIILYGGNLNVLEEGPNSVLLGNVARFKRELSAREDMIDHLLKKGKKIYVGKQIYFLDRFYLYFSKLQIPRRVLENIDYLVYRFVETSQFVRNKQLEDRVFDQFMATDGEAAINPVRTITVRELAIIFNIWFYGIVTASLILIVEMAKQCRDKRRYRRVPANQHRLFYYR